MSAEVSAHTVTREISTRGADLWYCFKHYLNIEMADDAYACVLTYTVHKVIQA